MIDSDFGYRSTTKTSFLKNRDYGRLWEIWESNIRKTGEALDILCDKDDHFHFFRISSSLFPLATLDDPEISSFWKDRYPEIVNRIKVIGDRVKFVGDKITLGPANNCVTPPFKAYEALNAFVAYEAVPKSEPVIPFDTVSEFSEAFEPDTTTLFQFGI
jgi:hypothetical protein